MNCDPNPVRGRPGFWHCPVCGYTNKAASDAPFQKNCHAASKEVSQEWFPTAFESQPRGLGDHLKTFINRIGLSWFPAWYKRTTGKNCGCKKRQEKCNKAFPDDRSYAVSLWMLIKKCKPKKPN